MRWGEGQRERRTERDRHTEWEKGRSYTERKKDRNRRKGKERVWKKWRWWRYSGGWVNIAGTISWEKPILVKKNSYQITGLIYCCKCDRTLLSLQTGEPGPPGPPGAEGDSPVGLCRTSSGSGEGGSRRPHGQTCWATSNAAPHSSTLRPSSMSPTRNHGLRRPAELDCFLALLLLKWGNQLICQFPGSSTVKRRDDYLLELLRE